MLLMNELNNMLSPSRLSFSLSFRSFTPTHYGSYSSKIPSPSIDSFVVGAYNRLVGRVSRCRRFKNIRFIRSRPVATGTRLSQARRGRFFISFLTIPVVPIVTTSLVSTNQSWVTPSTSNQSISPSLSYLTCCINFLALKERSYNSYNNRQ